jgi:hypothetical protein
LLDTYSTIVEIKNDEYEMSEENNDHVYYDLYKESKITIAELREFAVYQDWSDEQLQELSDQLFDLAILAQKIIIEENV